MAWGIYSAEAFPKWDVENGCMVDYRQSLGVQVILHAKTWTTLEDFYTITRYESWIDAAGEGKEAIITGKQVAERMTGDFRLRGIGCCDMNKATDAEKEKIATDCDAQNMKYRRMFIDRFEQQFRTKTQGGPGRWTPTSYEDECYKLHGLKPPDVVQKAPEHREQDVKIIKESVDPEILQQLVQAEVERQRMAQLKR